LPLVVATLNDYNVMLVKVRGEFVWHSHPETGDFFLVLDGQLAIDLRDRTVLLETGELFVVPPGVEHRLRAEEEAHVVLIEPRETVNTCDAPRSELTTEARPVRPAGTRPFRAMAVLAAPGVPSLLPTAILVSKP
jgi:mannose-6-phosphate isomerase-like protein (cupin superfamily)